MTTENELMIDCNGYIYFNTSEVNVTDACRRLMEAFESVGINVDNVEFMNAELRNGEGDVIDK